jgi:lysophospholipase L1-like esterase
LIAEFGQSSLIPRSSALNGGIIVAVAAKDCTACDSDSNSSTMNATNLLRCLALTLTGFTLHAQDLRSETGAKSNLEFKDGDRLVLLGGTIIERDLSYGCLETQLTLALGDRHIAVRNLGWSGDTVFGDARSYFGPPEDGLQRLTGHLDLLKPSVAILCYGTDLAHTGLAKLPDFLSGYRVLVDKVREHSPGVRIAIAAPPPMENLGAPLPDQADANRNLASLRDALAQFAITQNASFIDLFEAMGGLPKVGAVAQPLTENGIHYTEFGYQKLAAAMLSKLGLTTVDIPAAKLTKLSDAVKAKDFLFFNRWRPQNETYLFGFRKHEQGQNAKEIPMYDPLISEADQKIRQIKTELLSSRTP